MGDSRYLLLEDKDSRILAEADRLKAKAEFLLAEAGRRLAEADRLTNQAQTHRFKAKK